MAELAVGEERLLKKNLQLPTRDGGRKEGRRKDPSISMGSSSNTSDGDKEKEKGKAMDSEPSFKEGDRVLAYHGPLLYEAKVSYALLPLPLLALDSRFPANCSIPRLCRPALARVCISRSTREV